MDDLTKAIMADEANLSYTERGIFLYMMLLKQLGLLLLAKLLE